MANKIYTPSVNIIRDGEKELDFIVTPNAKGVVESIKYNFPSGTHAYSIIGSYGTGKSSFLWALEQTIKRKNNYFDISFLKQKNPKIINIVGESHSLIDYFSDLLGVKNDLSGNQRILDALFQLYKKHDFLLIVIDEFGKFLEHAAKNNPEKEMYFVQQLAEFVNDANRNILLLTTLHQSFEAYSIALSQAQRMEWKKVKGRLAELTFNEPIEQLLFLAAKQIESIDLNKQQKQRIKQLLKLNEKHGVFKFSKDSISEVSEQLFPLDLFAATTLTKSLQKYGQNERSLFSFLKSEYFNWHKKNHYFDLAEVYDYLYNEFYSDLNTARSIIFKDFQPIRTALDKISVQISKNKDETERLVKAIGLLQLFGTKGAALDDGFWNEYVEDWDIGSIQSIVTPLQQHGILWFSKYDRAYQFRSGTDVDFDEALDLAALQVGKVEDVVGKLKSHFDFPPLVAKRVSYEKGTVRLFDFVISDKPIDKKAKGALDGYINLIINPTLDVTTIQEHSAKNNEAILYGLFQESEQIISTLQDIEKTQLTIKQHSQDRIAVREFESIYQHHKQLLQHYVIDALYSDKVQWFFQGEEKEDVKSQRKLNQLLSEICEKVYHKSPKFVSELANRHKISGSISFARKNLFKQLVNHWQEADLGFETTKFPAEKTIYLSLLQSTGLHNNVNDGFELSPPEVNTSNNWSSFQALWDASENFLNLAREEKRNLTNFYDLILEKPYKIKQGFADFWIPIFLFIKRGDYALYHEGRFVSSVNESILYLMTRNPQDFEVKSLWMDNIRIKLFNKYRDFLQLNKKEHLTTGDFIESIKPFLIFYQNLPKYTQQTQRLPEEALALRDAIRNAKDPEKTFFEDFPAALHISIDDLANSEEQLAKFVGFLNEAIDQLKNAYSNLLQRFESYIQEEVVGKNKEFPHYKEVLKKRVKGIKDHQLLAHQKSFYNRLTSPLNDRESWLVSFGHPVLKKSIEEISDKEEEILKDKFSKSVRELENLAAIHKVKKEDDSDVFQLSITTLANGHRLEQIRIPKNKEAEINRLKEDLKKTLSKSSNINLAVLTKLLNEELNK